MTIIIIDNILTITIIIKHQKIIQPHPEVLFVCARNHWPFARLLSQLTIAWKNSSEPGGGGDSFESYLVKGMYAEMR